MAIVEQLDQFVREKQSLSFQASENSDLEPSNGTIPLSLAQQRLWFFDQWEEGTGLFNLSLVVRLNGKLNLAALQHALNAVVSRHQILRTTYVSKEGKPFQVLGAPREVDLPVINIGRFSGERSLVEERALIEDETRQGFNLSRDLMLRALLLRKDQRVHVLCLTMHQIAADRVSVEILGRELSCSYNAFLRGEPPLLTKLTWQYADFALWQRQWLEEADASLHLEYWKERAHGAPAVLDLPSDRPRPAEQSFQGGREAFRVPSPLVAKLKALSCQEATGLSVVVLAAFQVLLHRYSGQDDVVVGVYSSDRILPGLPELIGCFSNTLFLRADLSGNPSFREFLGRVHRTFLEAQEHQILPFERLLEESKLKWDPSRAPMFQVTFEWRNTTHSPLELEGLRVIPIELDGQTSQYDLTLSVGESGPQLEGWLYYSTDLYLRSTIQRMLGNLLTLLEAIVANPDERLSLMRLLTPVERERLLVGWNEVFQPDEPSRCLHHLVEAQVEKNPEAIAVVIENEHLTYGQLNRRANQVARYLQRKGAGPEVLVGLFLNKSLEMVVGLLGTLKTGAAYVPLDPDYPPERLDFMIKDTRIPLLLTCGKLRAKLPQHSAEMICLDLDWELISQEDEENPASLANPSNLACILYTSGSTGKPKGVMLEHLSLVSYTETASDRFGLQSSDRVLQFASICFDSSLEEIFPCWSRGASLVLCTDGMLESLEIFLRRCNDLRISVLDLPTGYWHELTRQLNGPNRLSLPPSVRLVIIGGERCLPDRVATWNHYVDPRVRLVNTYGPTEGTIVSTMCDLSPRDNGCLPPDVSIGRPIRNVQVYILDHAFQPVPVGVPGELLIGGRGLARGYLHRPDLTSERFIPNPFSDDDQARLYRTGDWARYHTDGTIEFLGRRDHQVKIRGFRVELDEIEAALAQHNGIKENVVVARQDDYRELHVVAYLVPVQQPGPTVTELYTFLRGKLPVYMVPSSFVSLTEMPLLPNGKVDRKRLPEPEAGRPQLGCEYAAPRTTEEAVLAGIWARLLGVKEVGIRDNFFELGGHSLLAVRLCVQIEKGLGKHIPLAALYQAPTVEQLAELLCREGWSVPWTLLVPIQSGGSRPPFFLHHGTEGLSRGVGEDQPFYLLEPHGIDGRRAPGRIEEMAADYLREIRVVQAEGPYYIGGYSMGGLVAYETAQQLRRQGQEVALLLLLDPTAPIDWEGKIEEECDGERVEGEGLRERIKSIWQKALKLGMKDKLSFVRGGLEWRLEGRWRRLKELSECMLCRLYLSLDRRIPPWLRLFYFEMAGSIAAGKYKARAYDGQIVLLEANGGSESFSEIWRDLAGRGLQIHLLSGSHLDVIKEPQAQEWANQLASCLSSAIVTKHAEQDVISVGV